ncbi:MAG TPA: DNA-formamidopyrimidine glycosylase [Candidatus Limnocylindrales bacterium]|nr:DNA-formamidopyrimidine glycosylase [Candidatus Limnocylindrales bacterium]
MPELPEVETVVRELREPLVGRTALGVWVDWPNTLRGMPSEDFAARIHGQTFRAINRRAKYILCQLDHDVLVVHLKMTGRLYVTTDEAVHDSDRWVHFRLQLDGGQQLRFSDARKFGFVSLTQDINVLAPGLGVEPLEDEFTVTYLAEQLARHRKAIKALLLDQTMIAGVGNIYADEALHRARIHPLRPSDGLRPDEIAALHEAVRHVLAAGIVAEGASINWYRKPDGTQGSMQSRFVAYGREGEPCPVCGAPIEKIRVAQRGTHFCPVCQPAPLRGVV